MKLPHRRQFLHLAAGAAALPAVSRVAWAQMYPSRPVRLIIPFAPGGGADIIGRMVATQLSDRLGKSFVVDNRGGAGGVVGTEIAANAPKDGYTLLGITLSHAVNPWFYKLSYDPIKSFSPIAILASGPLVLAISPDLPVKNVKELIDLARQRPGQLQFASAGVGTVTHLGGELFNLAAGVKLLHIPFRGVGPALIDVVGGHTKLAFVPIVAAMPHIRSGKLKAIGFGGTKRNILLPEVPTIAEAGVPGYEATQWWGILAPAGTPAAIVETLHRAITEAQNSTEVQKQFAAEGAEAINMSSDEFGAFIVKEMSKWEAVVKEGRLKPE